MLYHCRFHSPYSILCSFLFFFFFLMIRRPPRSTLSSSSAASDVYKRQVSTQSTGGCSLVAWGSEQPRSSISMLDRTQVTEIPNKAPPDYAELSALELMTGDLKGMFGSAAGSGMVPEDMQVSCCFAILLTDSRGSVLSANTRPLLAHSAGAWT
eukprot:TRINITY_DN1825_c0_g1_i5.p1 TRINITY_DN1825_c0_g1~~TRINITY_DN1825_c0_g1_i5.p1  ORF type:complete len:154 (+),score=19.81 TRINITY_DN1825_c0_g1_i5:19-480(+)